MQKIVCIVGPTATGKTALALELASKFNGALISADSVQVFRGLDIVSGKDIPKGTPFHPLPEMSSYGYNTGYFTYFNTPIYLLDVVEPTASFSVFQFHTIANHIVHSIKDKLPIVVGGTGLYVKSLLYGLTTSSVVPNNEVRKKIARLPIATLQNKLRIINEKKFYSMNESDRNNPRRLIRAIEVANLKNGEIRNTNKSSYNSLEIGLTCDRTFLKQRIDTRVQERLESGALNEAEKLFENYEKLSQQVKDANGYKQLFSFLKKEISWDEAIYRWKISEYHHAKNQMTWFKKYGNVVWFDIGSNTYKKDIDSVIDNFITENRG